MRAALVGLTALFTLVGCAAPAAVPTPEIITRTVTLPAPTPRVERVPYVPDECVEAIGGLADQLAAALDVIELYYDEAGPQAIDRAVDKLLGLDPDGKAFAAAMSCIDGTGESS